MNVINDNYYFKKEDTEINGISCTSDSECEDEKVYYARSEIDLDDLDTHPGIDIFDSKFSLEGDTVRDSVFEEIPEIKNRFPRSKSVVYSQSFDFGCKKANNNNIEETYKSAALGVKKSRLPRCKSVLQSISSDADQKKFAFKRSHSQTELEKNVPKIQRVNSLLNVVKDSDNCTTGQGIYGDNLTIKSVALEKKKSPLIIRGGNIDTGGGRLPQRQYLESKSSVFLISSSSGKTSSKHSTMDSYDTTMGSSYVSTVGSYSSVMGSCSMVDIDNIKSHAMRHDKLKLNSAEVNVSIDLSLQNFLKKNDGKKNENYDNCVCIDIANPEVGHSIAVEGMGGKREADVTMIREINVANDFKTKSFVMIDCLVSVVVLFINLILCGVPFIYSVLKVPAGVYSFKEMADKLLLFDKYIDALVAQGALPIKEGVEERSKFQEIVAETKTTMSTLFYVYCAIAVIYCLFFSGTCLYCYVNRNTRQIRSRGKHFLISLFLSIFGTLIICILLAAENFTTFLTLEGSFSSRARCNYILFILLTLFYYMFLTSLISRQRIIYKAVVSPMPLDRNASCHKYDFYKLHPLHIMLFLVSMTLYILRSENIFSYIIYLNQFEIPIDSLARYVLYCIILPGSMVYYSYRSRSAGRLYSDHHANLKVMSIFYLLWVFIFFYSLFGLRGRAVGYLSAFYGPLFCIGVYVMECCAHLTLAKIRQY